MTNDMTFAMQHFTLKEYQQEAVVRISLALSFKGISRQLVVMPTGSGKSVVAAGLCETLLELESDDALAPAGSGRMLFLAPREEIAKQTYKTFLRAGWPASQLGLVQGKHNAAHARFVFATVPTLAKRNRLAQVLSAGPFALVIADEAHHGPAQTWRELLGYYLTDKQTQAKRLIPGLVVSADTLLVGFTATPNRADELSLATIFEEITHSVGMLDLLAQDPPDLADPKRFSVPVPHLDLSAVPLSADGDFQQEALSKAILKSLQSGQRHQVALDLLKAYHLDHLPGLYFGVDRADAAMFAKVANAAGIPTAFLSGETNPTKRKELFADYLAGPPNAPGQLQYLSGVDVFGEGTDLPRSTVAIMGGHTKSPGKYLQRLGRITRVLEEDRGLPQGQRTKPYAYVLDLTDTHHTCLVLPEMLGTTEVEMADKSVGQLLKDKVLSAKPAHKEPVYTPGSTVRVAASSIFTSRQWKRVGSEYKLVTPFGTYLARPTLGLGVGSPTYELFLYSAQGVKTLAKPSKLEHALGRGEEHLQLQEVRVRRQSDPNQRRAACSMSQLQRLRQVWPSLYRNRTSVTQGEYQDRFDELKSAGGNVSRWWREHGAQYRKSSSSGSNTKQTKGTPV